MKRLAILCLLLVGCAGIQFNTKHPVSNEYRSSYLASVSICDGKGNAHGAGTIIEHKEGKGVRILTAAHVVMGFAEKELVMFACYSFTDKMAMLVPVKLDVVGDLAILKSVIKAKKNGPYAKVAKKEPKIGDKVFVIGAPMGKKLTMTLGIISNCMKIKDRKLYRTDAAAFFGNSGGGVFNADRELVGVLVGGEAIGGVAAVPGAAYATALPHVLKLLK